MSIIVRPKIIISKCLGFENCRYNGEKIKFDIVEQLQKYIDFVTVCPEYDIGLGIPRDPIKLVQKSSIHLVQSATGEDITDLMHDYTDKFILSIQDIDGIIAKSKSPSCGVKTVNVYDSEYAYNRLHKFGTGLFIAKILEHYSWLPVIDDINIINENKLDKFFTALFMHAEFRNKCISLNDLLYFQKRNKLLLMTFSQCIQKKLDMILSNNGKFHSFIVIEKYIKMFIKLMHLIPSRKTYVNAFMHAYGYLSYKLNSEEKSSLLVLIQAYIEDNIATVEVRNRFNYYIKKYEVIYLINQSLFFPYPKDLFNNINI